ADDPAALARRIQAGDVVEPDVLVDLLVAAHARLVLGAEPDEHRVMDVDRERAILPGVAAVVRHDARAPLADGPPGLRVDRVHAEEVGALVGLQVRLALPGTAAVAGAQDRARLPDRPAV